MAEEIITADTASAAEPEPVEPDSPLLTGNLRQVVFLLALPALCEQFLTFCVGFYDTWLSGRISASATSAIGTSSYVSWLGQMIFGMVGIGTSALISRFWGARNYKEANRVLNVSLMLAPLLGALVCGGLYLSAPLFTHFLNMTGETRDIAINYMRIDSFGLWFTGFTIIGAGALRGTGNMRTPMLVFGMVCITNIIVSTLLVYGLGPIPALGVYGIVGGTIVARISGGLLILGVLWKGWSGLRIDRTQMSLRDPLVKRILRIGLPGALDGWVMWIGHFAFLRIISQLGQGEFQSAAFAAHIIGVEIEAITYLPATAWGQAASTLTGQALGAGRINRAREIGHEAVLQCAMLGVVITTLFFAGADRIYQTMHQDPNVQQIGAPAFRILAFFQIPLIAGIIYVYSLRGAGDSRTPLFITLFSMFFVRLPLAYYCGIVLNGGLMGAWAGMWADMLLRCLLASTVYLRGKWVHTQV